MDYLGCMGAWMLGYMGGVGLYLEGRELSGPRGFIMAWVIKFWRAFKIWRGSKILFGSENACR